MKSSLRALSLLLLAVILAGCTTTSFRSRAPEYAGEKQVTAIYLYSFLDLREEVMGRRFLAEVKRQLDAALTAEGVKTKQFWFDESPLRAQFSLEAKRAGWAKTATRVPVDEVVKASTHDERAFGASHRLIVFPASVMRTNTGNNFTIRWDLVDSQSDQRVWTTSSSSNHMDWLMRDENAQERARTFVDSLITELKRTKVLPAQPTPNR